MGWVILDCAGHNPNCTTNQVVENNPDIAGIGVIVGFLSTTCLAFLIAFTVIFLDRYERAINLIRRYITRNKTPYSPDAHGPYWRSPAFWSRVLSKNLLAFSDTQLLTGLAIQFTAMLKHCTMSVYHFRVVTDLAFLTTVTHLLTVVALRNYFVRNPWINLPRVFFMLGNLALLGYTSFVAYSYDKVAVREHATPSTSPAQTIDLSMPLACFFQGTRPPITDAFAGKWAALIIGAIGGHVTVILAMYYFSLTPPSSESRRAWWWWLGAAFRTWIVAPVYAIYGIWMAGDGLRHTQALGEPSVTMAEEGSETEWNFGQFLPVLLLALPVFAGWESFWEEKDEDRENRFGRKSFRKSFRRRKTDGTTSVADMSGGSGEVLEKPAPVVRRIGSREERDIGTEEREVESAGVSPIRGDHVSSSTSAVDMRPVSQGVTDARRERPQLSVPSISFPSSPDPSPGSPRQDEIKTSPPRV